MAHGFLSYEDSRGVSGIEKALEDYLEKKFKDLKNHLLKERKKTDQKIDEVSVKVEGPAALGAGQQPLLSGGNQKAVAAAPVQRMLGGTALQRSLPVGAAGVNPDVMGGGLSRTGFNGRPLRSEGFVSDRIVDIGATNLGVERDIGGDDMFVKRMESVGGDSGEVVQAIDRLTMVTMSLVAATQQQTQAQQLIAQTQQQEAEKLGRKSLAASEEFSLEGGGDFSSNAAYMGLGANGMALMGRGGGGGGVGLMGLGAGIGGKAMAARMGRSVMRRGGARAGKRLGIALGGRMSKGLGKGLGKKLGGKAIGKLAGGALAKSLGKKIPLVGLGLGAVFAAQRALQGDFLGAGLELASGAASTVPGAGTAASVGIDAALMAKDMTAMAEGGITDGPVNALIGESGKEGVFPLEGSEGKKTFTKFGEGILDAQRKNKGVFGKLQAEGFKQYYDKGNGWNGFFTGLKEILGGFKFPGGYKPFNFDGPDEPDDDDTADGLNRSPGASRYQGTDYGYDLPRTNTMLGQEYGASRDGGNRKHAGQDFDTNAGHNSFASQLGGTVVFAGNVGGDKGGATGYGNVVDIYNAELGRIERIAEGEKMHVKVGDIVSAGDIVMSGESKNDDGSIRTGVIHYEIRKPQQDMDDLSKYEYSKHTGFAGTEAPIPFLRKHASHDDISNITDRQVVPLGDLSLEPAVDPAVKRLEQLKKLRRALGVGDDGALKGKLESMQALSNKENRSLTDEEDVHIPGVGRISHFNNKTLGMGVNKFTFFDEGEKELTMEEFMERLNAARDAAKSEQERLLEGTGDQSSNVLNNASEEAVLNASTKGNTVINNYNTVTGSGNSNSSGGDDVLVGSNFNQMGPDSIFNTMALRSGC